MAQIAWNEVVDLENQQEEEPKVADNSQTTFCQKP
jgi:hypothetical protein